MVIRFTLLSLYLLNSLHFTLRLKCKSFLQALKTTVPAQHIETDHSFNNNNIKRNQKKW